MVIVTHNLEHVFVDIECFGNGMLAPVAAIAAVKFNPHDESMTGDSFYATTVPPKSAQYDYETVMWWLQQSREARNALSGVPVVPLGEALTDLTTFCKSCKRIWSRGNNYDLRILSEWYTYLNISKPLALVDFRGWRDSRALTDLVPQFYADTKSEIFGHIATFDCVREIRTIQHVYSLIARQL